MTEKEMIDKTKWFYQPIFDALQAKIATLRSLTRWHAVSEEPEIGLYLCTFNFSHYELMDYRYGEWREWDYKLGRYTKTHDVPSHWHFLPKEEE